MTDGSFIQNCTEAFKDGCVCFGRVFCEKSANFTGKPNSNLDGVISWAFEQQDKYLKRDDFMRNGLVDEVCDEGGS